ncbi:hypothetical protein AL072_09540 [Azospirillum thiophilum]|uniref:Uncharacterized protein n=2 Tax=Azospirillum thiophilum TaxID=528244 RepID=A0AAC8VXF7_9PROT|nr:hypothetical protein AL072_09540 [Azospirillum thiophilum]
MPLNQRPSGMCKTARIVIFQKPQPLAICLECGAPYGTLEAITHGCRTPTPTGRCEGEVAARWNDDDWTACPSCDSTGCPGCGDVGWLAVPY